MPKVTYTASKGLETKSGSGFVVKGAAILNRGAQIAGAFYSGVSTITANATASSAPLGDGPVQLVDSGNNSHKVQLPLAKDAGQLMIVRNVDDAQDVVIRNNADGATLLTLGEGKTAILVSTASGDNWSGSQVD